MTDEDDALRFLSHDARQSGATILAMLDLARRQPEAWTHASLLQAIEREAEAGLQRIDDFVALAHAQGRPLRTECLDLVALLRLVADAAWALADRHEIRILLADLPDEALCLADRGLLMRVLDALLDSALHRAPAGSTLHCAVAAWGPHWRVSVREPGAASATDPLKSRQICALAQRQGATIEIEPTADAGRTVSLVLPRLTAAELAALEFHSEQ